MTTLADSTASSQRLAGPAFPEQPDHHTSGDSIPVGFEAAHLNHNLTRDSGMASGSQGPALTSAPGGLVTSERLDTNPGHLLASMAVFPSQPLCPSPGRQDSFCPVPESTFIPVEPAKEPVSH